MGIELFLIYLAVGLIFLFVNTVDLKIINEYTGYLQSAKTIDVKNSFLKKVFSTNKETLITNKIGVIFIIINYCLILFNVLLYLIGLFFPSVIIIVTATVVVVAIAIVSAIICVYREFLRKKYLDKNRNKK